MIYFAGWPCHEISKWIPWFVLVCQSPQQCINNAWIRLKYLPLYVMWTILCVDIDIIYDFASHAWLQLVRKIDMLDENAFNHHSVNCVCRNIQLISPEIISIDNLRRHVSISVGIPNMIQSRATLTEFDRVKSVPINDCDYRFTIVCNRVGINWFSMSEPIPIHWLRLRSNYILNNFFLSIVMHASHMMTRTSNNACVACVA